MAVKYKDVEFISDLMLSEKYRKLNIPSSIHLWKFRDGSDVWGWALPDGRFSSEILFERDDSYLKNHVPATLPLVDDFNVRPFLELLANHQLAVVPSGYVVGSAKRSKYYSVDKNQATYKLSDDFEDICASNFKVPDMNGVGVERIAYPQPVTGLRGALSLVTNGKDYSITIYEFSFLPFAPVISASRNQSFSKVIDSCIGIFYCELQKLGVRIDYVLDGKIAKTPCTPLPMGVWNYSPVTSLYLIAPTVEDKLQRETIWRDMALCAAKHGCTTRVFRSTDALEYASVPRYSSDVSTMNFNSNCITSERYELTEIADYLTGYGKYLLNISELFCESVSEKADKEKESEEVTATIQTIKLS